MSESRLVSMVREFREKLSLPVSDSPRLLTASEASFYVRFVSEEVMEFSKSLDDGNLVEAADAVADILYVVIGCSLHMGLPIDSILSVVHDANMAKVPGSGKRGLRNQDAIKPAGWVGPEERIKKLLTRSRLHLVTID